MRPPHDDLPTRPTQRRTATALGCLLITLILAVLVWFAVNNTETEDNRGFLGRAAPAAEAPSHG